MQSNEISDVKLAAMIAEQNRWLEESEEARPRFAVGDVVARIAFDDCFGKPVARIDGLTVERVTRIDSEHGYPTYFRLYCRGGLWAVAEGAERFFERA